MSCQSSQVSRALQLHLHRGLLACATALLSPPALQHQQEWLCNTVLQADACSGSSLWCTAPLLILMQFLEIKQEQLNSFSPAGYWLSQSFHFSLPLPAVREYGIEILFEPQTKDQGCISQGQIPLLSGNGPLSIQLSPCHIQHPAVGDVQSPKD